MRKDCKKEEEKAAVENCVWKFKHKRSSLGDENEFFELKSHLSLCAIFPLTFFFHKIKQFFCYIYFEKISLRATRRLNVFLMFHHWGLHHKFSPYILLTRFFLLLCLISIMMKIFLLSISAGSLDTLEMWK